MRLKSGFILLVSLFFYHSCYFDNKEELYQNLIGSCDPLDVGFQERVEPILNSNCSFSGCHDSNTSAAGLDLTIFSEISRTAKSGILVNRLNGIGGNQMPLSANPLSDCQIKTIETWVSEGALNN